MEDKTLRSHWKEATRTDAETGDVEYGYECANCHRFEKEQTMTLRCLGCQAWMSGLIAAISKKEDHPVGGRKLWNGRALNSEVYCSCPKCGGMDSRHASSTDNIARQYITKVVCADCGFEIVERHYIYAINFHELIPSIDAKLRDRYNNIMRPLNVTEEGAPFVTWNDMISKAKSPADRSVLIVAFMAAVDSNYAGADWDRHDNEFRELCVFTMLSRPYTGTDKVSYQLPKVKFRTDYEAVWREAQPEPKSDSVKSPASMNGREFVDFAASQFPNAHEYMTVEEFLFKLDKMLTITGSEDDA